MGWVVNAILRPHTPGKDPVPIVEEAGWVPGLVWTCAGNLTATVFRSPACAALSESLYRLHYLGPHCTVVGNYNM